MSAQQGEREMDDKAIAAAMNDKDLRCESPEANLKALQSSRSVHKNGKLVVNL